MRRGRGAISHFSISDFSRMLISVPCVRRAARARSPDHEDGPAGERERDGDAAVAARVAVGAAEGLHPFTN